MDTERCRHEYYLRPTLDVLEAAITPHQWIEQRGTIFEISLAQRESLAAAVGLLTCPALTGMWLIRLLILGPRWSIGG